MEYLLGIEQAFYGLAAQLGSAGILIISFIGASSIIIPIPYQLIVFWVGANTDINPYILIASAGLGSALGEVTGYFVGYAAKHAVSESRKRKFNAMLKILMRHRNVWPLIIFIFAFTPLPDDLLFIPLGLVHFSFPRAFIPCLLGKLAMFTVLVFGGRYASGLINSFFGGESSYEGGIVFTVITIVLLVATVIGMWKVDWEKLLARYEILLGTPYKGS